MNISFQKKATSRAIRSKPRDRAFSDMLIATIMLLLTAFVPAMSKLHQAGEVSDNSVYNQVVWGVIYVVAAFKVSSLANIGAVVRFSWTLILFAVWMLLSTLWSVVPDVTIRESIELAGTTLVGIYLVVLFPLEKLLTVISLVIGAIAVSSAFLIVFAPARGRMSYGAGAWSGIYEEKNLLGAAMALGIVSLMAFALHARGRSLIRVIATILICVAILIGANSITSVADGVVTLILMFTIVLLRSSKTTGFARVGIVIVAVAALLFSAIYGFQLGSIFEDLGRSSDLTGRTTFWPALWTAINDRPVVGYGYGAFFKSATASNYLSDFLSVSGGWTPYHAHSSMLQVLLNGGYVGLGISVMSLVVGLRRGFAFAFQPGNATRVWPVCIIVYLIIGSYSETYLGGINSIEALLFIAAFLYPVRRYLLKSEEAHQAKSEVPIRTIRRP